MSGASTPLDDPAPPLGVRIDAAVAGARLRVDGRPSFVLALHGAVFACRAEGLLELGAARALSLDASHWLLVPRGQTARLTAQSPTAQLLVLSPHPPLLRAVEEAYAGEVDPATMRRLLATAWLAPRTVWVSEVAQRYAFERGVCAKRDNVATAFLEMEILKEWYFVRRDAEDRARPRRSHVEAEPPLVARAQRYVDAHLATRIDVASLARAVHASPSALLRAFRGELGTAPMAYVRARRLDEALILLRSGRYAVGEIASRVGYESFAAFSHAFRARFGEAPSRFLPVPPGR